MNASTKHELFLVGRIAKGERRVIFLQVPAKPPFPGPWDVRAIFAK